MRYLLRKKNWPALVGFLCFTLGLMACRSEPAPAESGLDTAGTLADLKVINGPARMRDRPAPEGTIVRELPTGAGLQDLGGISDQTTRIRYGPQQFDEPWLQVRDSTGQTGWIYAREVAPSNTSVDLLNFRRRKQLQSIFGPAAYQSLQAYQNRWKEAGTDKQIAGAYQSGSTLRDTLVPQLEKKSNSYAGEALPDLFWMEAHIPGYVLQLVAEGTIYYLFHDYGQWLALARQSGGQQDDRFFELMIRCYPQDSIEYFYPAWELQTWDYGGHHLLGRGIAYEILAGIEQIHEQTPLFSRDLLQLKDQLLASITQPNIHFWEPDSLVKQELDAIIQANWGIFTATDQIAVDTRRSQLDSAAIYGIRFNARAGE